MILACQYHSLIETKHTKTGNQQMSIAKIIFKSEKSQDSLLAAAFMSASNVRTFKHTGNTQFTFVDGSRLKLCGATHMFWVV